MSLSSEILSRSPLLFWKLNETSGTNAADSSGNGRDGTYTGTVTLNSTSLVDGTGSLSVAANGYVAIADAAWMDINQGALLFEFATTSASSQFIGGRNNSAGTGWMYVDMTSGNQIRLYLTTGGGETTISASSTGMRDGNPHQVIGTYDGTNMKLYVDGAEVATSAKTGNLANVSQPFQVARRGTSATFNGRLGYATIFGSGLSSGDVTALYNATLGGTQYAAAGTVDGVSAVAGATTSRLVGSGTVAGTSAVTGAAASLLAASGTVAAVSGVTGSAAIAGGLTAAGTVAGTSGVAGSATLLAAASGSVAGTSTVTGTTGLRAVATGVITAVTDTIGDVLARLTASGIVEAVSAVFGAAGVPQPPVDTPDERTLYVGAEARSLAIPGEDRTLVVAADPRALAVATENRTLGVTQ
jgi:hypothetical protein